MHHPESANIVPYSRHEKCTANAKCLFVIPVASFPRCRGSSLARVGENQERRPTQVSQLLGGQHSFMQMPAASAWLDRVIMTMSSKVHAVMGLQLSEQLCLAHQFPPDERYFYPRYAVQ